MATLKEGAEFFFIPGKRRVKASTKGNARVLVILYNPKTPPKADNPQGVRSENLVLSGGHRMQTVEKKQNEADLAIFVKNYGPSAVTATAE